MVDHVTFTQTFRTMYIVQFNNQKYEFSNAEHAHAKAFAEKWGTEAKYQSLCGDPNCQCESLCKSFHFGQTNTNNQQLPTNNQQP